MANKLTQLAQTTVTTAGTRVRLNSGTSLRTPMVIIQNDPSNAGNVYVGDSSVDATHAVVVLQAGESISITTEERRTGADSIDLADIYVDASANSTKVNVGYLIKR